MNPLGLALLLSVAALNLDSTSAFAIADPSTCEFYMDDENAFLANGDDCSADAPGTVIWDKDADGADWMLYCSDGGVWTRPADLMTKSTYFAEGKNWIWVDINPNGQSPLDVPPAWTSGAVRGVWGVNPRTSNPYPSGMRKRGGSLFVCVGEDDYVARISARGQEESYTPDCMDGNPVDLNGQLIGGNNCPIMTPGR